MRSSRASRKRPAQSRKEESDMRLTLVVKRIRFGFMVSFTIEPP
jgi:hypothetical protein